jgi:hypothetical protein
MRDETPTDDQLLDAAAYAAAVDLLTGSRHVRGRGQGRPTEENEDTSTEAVGWLTPPESLERAMRAMRLGRPSGKGWRS